jgi:regulator of microtubule dynamics protein 3
MLAFLTAIPHAVVAQPIARFGGPLADADMLYFAGRPREALEVLTQRLEKDPEDYGALWRAARAGVVVGIAQEGNEQQNAWLDPAIQFGDRAVALRPDGLDGLYWRAAAEGRRAMNAGPGHAAELAQRVYEDAHSILAVDSLHSGAHNLLGKLNYEIMSLSRVERFIGKVFAHTDALRNSSWEDAEYHLRTAVEESPDEVLFRFDLAQLYRKRGRKDEAKEAFLRVTQMPAVEPPDVSFKEDAQRYLDQLGS